MSQIQRHCLILLLFLGNGWGFMSSHAQFTANFQTNVISGGVSNWAGIYFVGSNTFANALLIRNGGALTDADAHAGYLPASSSNHVLVAGAGSAWTNNNLYFGWSGGFNTMLISNAGRVMNNFASYVAHTAASSSNSVLVTGTNSLWNMGGELVFGNNGPGNRLVITNGGRVFNASGRLGEEPGSSGNTALVTGAGSSWTNTATLTVGRSGGYNLVTVNQGARLYSFYASLGTYVSSVSNSVVISDTNSIWDDSGETSTMNIGQRSSGNSIIVTNGGKILGYFVYLGRFGAANHNSVLVSGPGSTYSLNCHFYVGNQGSSNRFTAANGATIQDKFCYINYEAASSNNTVVLTGPNTTWNNEYSVFVGFAGGGGSLIISNGATMTTGGGWGLSHDGALGVDPTSLNNRALVTGAGSVWKCADSMYVGLNGAGNSLVISNGGRVGDTEGYIGSNHGSDNNQALVVGANSVWTNASNFHVGYFATNNQLVISNGGGVIAGDGSIGRASDSSRNRVIVTGTNSVWRNKTNLLVGCFGASNSLVVSNAAQVSAVYGYVGYGSDSHDNQVSVSGTGSVWTNSNATLIGNLGSSNTMTIRAGGLVSDYWGIIGDADESFDNTVYVEPGGTWRTQRLLVGHHGSHNALYVNGGSVFAGTSMDVGFDPVYPNNLAQLNSGEINVTNAAQNAVLEVYGGGFVLLGGILRVDTLIVTNAEAQFVAMGGTLSYRSLQLTPGFDVDTDGVPNGWEQMYALNPLDPFDAENDSDGDKMSNLEEYLAGTNPTNAASCLQITSQTISNHSVNVSWKAVGGKSYVVQKSPSPTAGFTDLSPAIPIPGTAEITTNYLDVGAATNWSGRFYRIRLGP
jgi:T5SS/PEP-CTERM-associated repeat protein